MREQGYFILLEVRGFKGVTLKLRGTGGYMEEKKNLMNIIVDKLKDLNIEILRSEDEISTFFLNEVLSTDNKEKMLLNFRRGMEMIIKKPLLVTIKSLSTNKIIAVRNDNLLQLLDRRYYSELQLSSFLDIFKIETNDFKSLNILGNEPHLKLIINYILSHYNTTFRKFMNRNEEYFYIYKYFFDNGENIKRVLDYLNSYHYSEDTKTLFDTLDKKLISKEINQIYDNWLPISLDISNKCLWNQF